MNDRKSASRQAFDRQAPTYDQDKNGSHARRLYGAVLNKLREYRFADLLDVGCGTGELLKQLQAEHASAQFAGVDLSAEMLKVAQAKLGEAVRLTAGDAEALPFADDAFDLVVCSDSFHHYPHPAKAVAEFHRVLKAGGVLLIGDYWKPFPLRQIMNFFMPFSSEGDIRIYSQKEMSALLTAAHFTSIEYEQANDSAFIVTAQKPIYDTPQDP